MSVRRCTPRVTAQAQQDYDNILLYTGKTWGEEQAAHDDAALDRAMRELLDHPRRGRAQETIAPGVWVRQGKQHAMCYRITPKVIETIRILHGKMDAVKHLKDRSP